MHFALTTVHNRAVRKPCLYSHYILTVSWVKTNKPNMCCNPQPKSASQHYSQRSVIVFPRDASPLRSVLVHVATHIQPRVHTLVHTPLNSLRLHARRAPHTTMTQVMTYRAGNSLQEREVRREIMWYRTYNQHTECTIWMHPVLLSLAIHTDPKSEVQPAI